MTTSALAEAGTLLASGAGRRALFIPGISFMPGCIELLVPAAPRSDRDLTDRSTEVVIGGAGSVADLPGTLHSLATQTTIDGLGAYVALGTGRAAGHIAAIGRLSDRWLPVPRLLLVGAGMLDIEVGADPAPERATSSRSTTLVANSIRRRPREHPQLSNVIWSRTRGALGPEAWRRLTSLSYAIIGCGRSGSLVAAALAGLGVSRLILIDPDAIELHNLGEMDLVQPRDVGRKKAASLAEAVSRRRDQLHHLFEEQSDPSAGDGFMPSVTATSVDSSIFALSALAAAKQADILVSCVDNPAARFAAALLAKFYLKPLLDLGTGIHFQPNAAARLDANGQRDLGADVRLILPDRCLLCFGGIADFSSYLRSLNDSSTGLEAFEYDDWFRNWYRPRTADDWQQQRIADAWYEQRAGSLHSLNQVAVGLGIRLLEDFVGRRIAQSTWLHLDYADHGIPALTQRTADPAGHCALCASRTFGDDATMELPALLSLLREEER